MSKTMRISLLVTLALAPLAALGVAAMSRDRAAAQSTREPAAAPVRAGAIRGLVVARPFVLSESYAHEWRLEEPVVNAGWLLVLAVDPTYVAPRQAAMPVLMAGEQTLECLNFGQDEGKVVVILPGPEIDLGSTPFWFGSPELPERVDAAWIAGERSRAHPADLVSFTAGEIAAARARGGAPLELADRVALHREAGMLILEHSPREREIAETLLVPVTK